MSVDSVESDGVEAMENVKLNILLSVRKIDFGYVTKWKKDPLRGPMVEVQPSRLIKDLATGQREKQALIPDVPVLYTGIGDFVVAGELEPDQPVLLLIADRNLAGWLEGKRLVDPPQFSRPHSLAGALALPLPKRGAAPLAALGKGLTVGKVDGSATIRITGDTPATTQVHVDGASVVLGGLVAAQPAAVGGNLVGALATFAAALTASAPTPPTPAEILAAASALAASLAIPAGSPGATLSAKTRIE